jgi:hypothetical protein
MPKSKTQSPAMQPAARQAAAPHSARSGDPLAARASSAIATAPTAAAAAADWPAQGQTALSGSDRAALPQAQIAEAAYYKALARGFAPGGELDDWLAAERELGAATQTTAA